MFADQCPLFVAVWSVLLGALVSRLVRACALPRRTAHFLGFVKFRAPHLFCCRCRCGFAQAFPTIWPYRSSRRAPLFSSHATLLCSLGCFVQSIQRIGADNPSRGTCRGRFGTHVRWSVPRLFAHQIGFSIGFSEHVSR